MKGLNRSLAASREGGEARGLNILDIGAAVQNGETITIGGTVLEVDTVGDGSTVTAGNTALDLSGGSTVQAQGTLTIAEPVTADDTMTIGATTYTFKAGATAAAGEIGLGADEAATKAAIVAAINGTDGFNTANASVTAAVFATDDCVLTAIVGGTVGNAIATTETFTHASNVFDAATVGTTTAGVDPTAAEAITAVTAALLAVETLDAYAVTGGVLVIDMRPAGSPLACSETLAGSGNAWQASDTYGYNGSLTGNYFALMQKRSPTAAEVAGGQMAFAFGLTPSAWIIQVRDMTGAAKAWDGTATVSGTALLLGNGGSTDWAATDDVTVLATFSDPTAVA